MFTETLVMIVWMCSWWS